MKTTLCTFLFYNLLTPFFRQHGPQKMCFLRIQKFLAPKNLLSGKCLTFSASGLVMAQGATESCKCHCALGQRGTMRAENIILFLV